MFSVKSKEGDIGDSSMARDKPVMVKLSLKVMCDKTQLSGAMMMKGVFLAVWLGLASTTSLQQQRHLLYPLLPHLYCLLVVVPMTDGGLSCDAWEHMSVSQAPDKVIRKWTWQDR